jgi:transcriptional regulator NrdR family protein
MVCTYCGGTTSVTNSRHQKRANQVWRRRRCDHCQSVVTTVEGLDYAASMSLKTASGVLRPFQRDILFISVYDSLRHRKTAVSDAEALTATILRSLPATFTTDRAVDRTKLIELVTSTLGRFDKAAAVQYGAFHPA